MKVIYQEREASYTVKPVLRGHPKEGPTLGAKDR